MAHVHHHGRIFVGRIMVIVACLVILGIDAMIFKQAGAPPHQFAWLQGVMIISYVWLFAGAWGIFRRTNWSRPLVLTILYAGAIGFFVLAVVTVGTADWHIASGLRGFLIAAFIYLIISLILTHSKHVRRLTSRAYRRVYPAILSR